MSFIVATFSIILLSCPAEKEMEFTKNNNVIKPTASKSQNSIVYKKVPTKWVKITKKSN